ncbi:hypothetical protein TRL7639_01762 [Falsiruegeria litorea R37]|uniref:Uncharacterized protein n=1 Tax=Falsiruegeria litorea R37 TaxID=1200284 RepID=A0A1Y5SAQ2_9RHOB|nr:hypothetical protein [Falsiruegeria litorea]SLN36384.1 hypothetical protein TRL7639_01762 [Falsiruegeria litorea R37]
MKQAIVILHGMGEQIPMQTLNSFVDAVWTTDKSLVNQSKPDPNTGADRSQNASWSKPDNRNNSSELRRITTERDEAGNYTDFYEYYWAHLMHGTTWEHVQSWIVDLLLRNPFKRVPHRVLHAWVVLWLIAAVTAYFTLKGMLPSDGAKPTTTRAILSGVGGLIVASFVSNVLIKRFGDVARYVKALPPNVDRRQEIRHHGVALLQRLIDSGDYDRIVVVAHSLGTIVAYDILSMLFVDNNQLDDPTILSRGQQPEREKLEDMIRDAAGLPLSTGANGSGRPMDVTAYQAQQAKALAEFRAQGGSWIISDFITLGSPLAHAEFLMSESHADLRKRQADRLLPTCPPMPEYDGTTKLRHITYDRSGSRNRTPQDPRTSHHAAPFAYTRWTNLYSDEKLLLTGDLISGPVAPTFGADLNGTTVCGIRDVGVLPALSQDGTVAAGHRRTFFSHNNYWASDKGSDTDHPEVPHHIAELRRALAILQP